VAATPGAFLAILEALPHSMRFLWQAVGLTGARISGMAGLRETDVQASYLTVTTKRAKRLAYPMLPPLARAVEAAQAWKARLGLISEYVFCTPRATPWNHRTFDAALSRVIRRRPALPKITPHSLRHMWASLAAAANFSPDYLQAGLGHDDRRSAEVYVHHDQGMRDLVVAAVMSTLTEPKPQVLLTQRVGT
jgi:integrase